MAEYIERTDELILAVNAGARAIEHTKRYHGASYCIGVFSESPVEIPYLKAAEILREFEEIPAADVVHVVHGRWEKASEYMPIYRCSICKERNLFKNGDNVFSNYCPNCGARMDGDGL